MRLTLAKNHFVLSVSLFKQNNPSAVGGGGCLNHSVLSERHFQLPDHIQDDGLFAVSAVVYNVLDVRVVLRGQDVEVIVHEAVDGGLQCIRNGGDCHQGKLRVVVLDVADVGDRQLRAVGQLFLSQAEFLTSSPDPNSDGAVI